MVAHVILHCLIFQLLSVSYEQFAVDLDERFGQSLWNEFPEMANKGTLFIKAHPLK